MTRLTIIPNVEKKRLVFDGRISSGEHVELRVAGFGDKIEEGRLRVRAVDFHGNTLAVFPGKVKDEDGNVEKDENGNDVWEKWGHDDDYGYATCLFNLNTIPALKYFRRGGECLIVLDDPELKVHYGSGHLCVLPWPKEIGEDEPVDLDAYPDNINEFGERLEEVEKDVEGFGENVADALAKSKTANENANDALTKAKVAIEASNDAKAKSENAVNAANTAAGLIAKSDELVEAAKNYAQDAKRVVDGLSDVAKSGSYNDLNDKPSIPSIAGLATTNEVEKSEARSRKELLEEVARAKGAEDGLSRDIARKADTTSLATETQRAMEAEASIRKELGRTATLDADGKIPSSQLPGFVDDVLEFASVSVFPDPGESGKIYISTETNKQYRWSGSRYVEISSSLALGETAATAYPGNKGLDNAQKIANLQTNKQDKLDARQLAAVNSGITAAKVAQIVTKSDVEPLGDGTNVIARIGGKEIKVPAGGGGGGTVKKVAGVIPGEDGNVPLTPANIGAATEEQLAAKADEFTEWVKNGDFEVVWFDELYSWIFVYPGGGESASISFDKNATRLEYDTEIATRKRVLRTGDVDNKADEFLPWVADDKYVTGQPYYNDDHGTFEWVRGSEIFESGPVPEDFAGVLEFLAGDLGSFKATRKCVLRTGDAATPAQLEALKNNFVELSGEYDDGTTFSFDVLTKGV